MPRPPAPAPASFSSVVEAGDCVSATSCLLAGRIGDHLAAWAWDGRTGRALDLPTVPLGDHDGVLGVAHEGSEPWIVLARTGSGEIVRGLRTLVPVPGGGMPTALTTVAGHLWLATDGPAGPALWTTARG